MLHESLSGLLNSCAFALRDFVLVVWKHQVLTAKMQIEARPKNFHAHGAALDVPARTSLAPRARPEYISILWNSRFPQCKVRHRFLSVVIALDPFADAHFVEVQFHELAVGAAAAAILFDGKVH